MIWGDYVLYLLVQCIHSAKIFLLCLLNKLGEFSAVDRLRLSVYGGAILYIYVDLDNDTEHLCFNALDL